MATINHSWYATNSVRRYPIDETASCLSDDGVSIPNGVIIDCSLTVHKSLGSSLFIGGLTSTDTLITVVLLASNVAPNAVDDQPIVEEVVPVAAVSVLKQDLVLYKNYRIDPIAEGVGGWIVFGEAATRKFVGRFASARQSVICTRCVRFYDEFPVKSLHKATGSAKLSGVVNLVAGNDVLVRGETLVVDGLLRRVGVIALNKIATDDNIFAKYIGPCGKRPESGSCDRTAVQFLGGAKPDCTGNVDVTFEFATVYPFPGNTGGLAVSIPTGVADICAGVTTLPDSEGNLPGVGQGGIFFPPEESLPSLPDIHVSVQSDSIACIDLPMFINFNEPNVLDKLFVPHGQFIILNNWTTPLLTEPSRTMPPLYDGWSDSLIPYAPNVLSAYILDTKNVAVFEDCNFVTGNFRIGSDFYLYDSSFSPRNAGLILNYNPDNDYYVHVYLDINSQSVVYRLCAPGGCSTPITAMVVDYPQSLVEVSDPAFIALWWRMEIVFNESNPLQPSVRLLQLVDDAPPFDEVATLDLRPWAAFVPRGWFGVGTDRSASQFANFWMENV